MDYIYTLHELCQQRHGGDLAVYGYIIFCLSPVISAHPINFFKPKATTADPVPVLAPVQKALLDSSTLFSNRLGEITNALIGDGVRTFEDVPHNLTEGFIELADGFYNSFVAWKEERNAGLFGRTWNSLRRLENAVVVEDDIIRFARALVFIGKLRGYFVDAFGVESVELLDAEIIEKDIGLAVEARNNINNTADGQAIAKHTRLIDRARLRVSTLGNLEALHRFDAAVYPA